ncbi:four helix bundle protein [Nostoc sphaeroides]|uniref:Four helix bundle protein n=1 Tax=Nostoc sphaeroides CCNUC1 TaxID=2653204 RepID=A0A5P8WES9_9NOSO|nr:four helix bundle protein [Nostoc sphaeroides]QFS51278.1 four helix bundle protein [Nostoc sphaeroides CCNUC1]
MDSVVYEKAYKFAIRIVNAYKYLNEEKKEYILSKQLVRSGTSIGANIAEANGAISQADFSAKISIAYKECLETKYWLSLLKDTGYIEQKPFDSIYKDADEIGKILFSILKTTKINQRSKTDN